MKGNITSNDKHLGHHSQIHVMFLFQIIIGVERQKECYPRTSHTLIIKYIHEDVFNSFFCFIIYDSQKLGHKVFLFPLILGYIYKYNNTKLKISGGSMLQPIMGYWAHAP